MFCYGTWGITSKIISALRKFVLDATAMTSPLRLKIRVRDLSEKWGEKRATQNYILSHHLPKVKLAACTVNMSSGQAAAKMHGQPPGGHCWLFTHPCTDAGDTSIHILYMHASTCIVLNYSSLCGTVCHITNVLESCVHRLPKSLDIILWWPYGCTKAHNHQRDLRHIRD